MQVVHQIDIQRRGGPCVRFPTSCVIRDLLNEAGLLKPFEPVYIIDVTFGQGIFYYSLKGKAVVAGVDIRRLDWVVKPRCFTQATAQSWRLWLGNILYCLGGRVDVAVVAPLWLMWLVAFAQAKR